MLLGLGSIPYTFLAPEYLPISPPCPNPISNTTLFSTKAGSKSLLTRL